MATFTIELPDEDARVIEYAARALGVKPEDFIRRVACEDALVTWQGSVRRRDADRFDVEIMGIPVPV